MLSIGSLLNPFLNIFFRNFTWGEYREYLENISCAPSTPVADPFKHLFNSK